MGEAGRGHRPLHRRVRCGGPGAYRRRSSVPGPGRRGVYRHLSGWADHRGRRDPGFRARRPGRRPAADPEPAAAGAGPAPVQDRHASPGQRPERGFFQNGGPARRRDGGPFLLRDPGGSTKPGGVLPDLHQPAHPRRDPGQPGPLPPLLRCHRGGGAPVLPLHRGQGGPLRRQAPAPTLHRAHGAGHRGALHPGLLLLPARGRAGGDAPHRRRTGESRDDPVGLRHRVRLRGPHRALPHPGAHQGPRTLRGGAIQRLLRL